MEWCVLCEHWDLDNVSLDKRAFCKKNNELTENFSTCPCYVRRGGELAAAVDDKKTVSANKPATVRVISEAAEREEELQLMLFEHQKKAVDKFRCLDDIALFFEMGCGKTVTCCMIAADKFLDKKIDSMLVVAPNDVHKQWFDDLCDEDSVLRKLLAEKGVDVSCQIVGGRGGQKQLYCFDDDACLHVVCVNIDTFSLPDKWKPLVEWAVSNKTMLVLDEATSIKNPQSKRSQRMLYEFNDVVKKGKTVKSSVKKENVTVRAVLTGTPVTNGPIDLWAIMEFVRPNYFGKNYYAFQSYYGMHTQLSVIDGSGRERTVNVLLTEKTWRRIKQCDSFIEAAAATGCSEDTYLTVKHQDKYLGPYKHADELKQLLEPVAVFAKLVDCVDMPAVNYVTRNVGLSLAQETAYKNMKQNLIVKFGDHVSSAKNQLVVQIRLQQIVSGFVMAHEDKLDSMSDDVPFWSDVNENYDVVPDEAVWLGESNPRLEALMRDIDELDKPLIVMTRFSAEAAKIYDMLKDRYDTCLVTGWKTIGSIDAFKRGEYDVMVANTVKIARGHNLQNAHVTLYYSNTFSMELRQQSEFRTFRIGQKNPCLYVDYVSGEIDKTVIEALRTKKNLLDYMRSNNIDLLANV